jgi:hypothetical protein
LCNGAAGSPVHEAQPNLLGVRIMHPKAVTSWAFASWSAAVLTCSIKRNGWSFCVQAYSLGCSKRLHHVSSSKPSSQSGCDRAN